VGERASRVGRTIQQALGDLLARGVVKDPRVSAPGLVSITSVTVGDDLAHARVHVSIYCGEPERTEALRGLDRAAGFLRQRLTDVMRSKRIPRLTFHLDDSMEHAAHIDAVLREIEEDRKK
jgi:ribosome-binding factor A